MFNSESSPFDYGIGIEWKSGFSGGENNVLAATKRNAFPVYLTGKYGIGEDLFYLVGRAGWAMYDTSDSIDGFYGAVGVGKQFGRITIEALYESMDLSESSYMCSGDRATVFADAPSTEIAKQELLAGNPPYKLEIDFSEKDIIEKRRYNVRVKIIKGEKLLFISTDSYDPFKEDERVIILKKIK